jgi:beta-lactamase regulating signal transducer with metallopeptidase domain
MSTEFLWEMAWKSSLLILSALVIVRLLTGRSAADRAFVLRLTVGLLLVMPAVALFGPRLALEQPAAVSAWAADDVEASEPAPVAVTGPAVQATATAAALAEPGSRPVALPLLLLGIYGIGVGVVLSHLAAGLWTLRRWTKAARPVRHPLWAAAYDRARLRSGVRHDVALLSSAEVPEPMGWGLRRPVILLDRQTVARDEQAEAVLGHEMAHVARGDWLALLMGRAMLALFWFNPLAWLLNRRMLEEAEAAADMHAVAQMDPAFYAQTLLTHALRPQFLALPATPMAGPSGMARRIQDVLDDRLRMRRSGSVWTGVACAAVLACGTMIAALELLPARPAKAGTVSAGAAAPGLPTLTDTVAAPVATVDGASTPDPVALEVALAEADARNRADADVPPEPPMPPAPPAPPEPPMPAAPPAPPAPPVPPSPPAEAFGELAALRALGVTEEWKAAMASALALRALDDGDAMGLKALGMSPDKARDLRAAGVKDLTPDGLMELAALGVTGAYVRELAAAGYKELCTDSLVELKAVGVTGAFAETARREGRARTTDELVELRVAGWVR